MSISIELKEKNLNILLPDNEKIELILCNAGTFKMGSAKTEISHMRNECLHQVTLTKDFYLGKYTLTAAQLDAILKIDSDEEWEKAKRVYKGIYEHFCEGRGEDGSYPAPVGIYVANRIFQLFNKLLENSLPERYSFDFPTEAQWEYACRAGTETGLNNGKNVTVMHGACPNLDEIAWYCHNSDRKIKPVGLKKPNAWGFYDMLGNVWEHTRSTLCDFSEEPEIDPECFGYRGYSRIIRGGCYWDEPWRCRSAMRGQYVDGEQRYLGTRIALVSI